MNWRRGVYTGNPNAPDEYYNAAMEPAGQVYNERKGAAHGVLSAASGVPGVGMLPGGVNAVLYEAEGEHGKAAMAAGEGAAAGIFGWLGKAGKAKQIVDAERAAAQTTRAGQTAAKAEETLAAAAKAEAPNGREGSGRDSGGRACSKRWRSDQRGEGSDTDRLQRRSRYGEKAGQVFAKTTQGWSAADKAALWQSLARQIEAVHSPAWVSVPMKGANGEFVFSGGSFGVHGLVIFPDGSLGIIGKTVDVAIDLKTALVTVTKRLTP